MHAAVHRLVRADILKPCKSCHCICMIHQDAGCAIMPMNRMTGGSRAVVPTDVKVI